MLFYSENKPSITDFFSGKCLMLLTQIKLKTADQYWLKHAVLNYRISLQMYYFAYKKDDKSCAHFSETWKDM